MHKSSQYVNLITSGFNKVYGKDKSPYFSNYWRITKTFQAFNIMSGKKQSFTENAWKFSLFQEMPDLSTSL